MHDYALGYFPEEFQAVLGLVEGETRILETEMWHWLGENLAGLELYNNRHVEREIAVARDRIGSKKGTESVFLGWQVYLSLNKVIVG